METKMRVKEYYEDKRFLKELKESRGQKKVILNEMYNGRMIK